MEIVFCIILCVVFTIIAIYLIYQMYKNYKSFNQRMKMYFEEYTQEHKLKEEVIELVMHKHDELIPLQFRAFAKYAVENEKSRLFVLIQTIMIISALLLPGIVILCSLIC